MAAATVRFARILAEMYTALYITGLIHRATVTRLLTPYIATMTELREPHKVLERANGQPVAILKNSALVGYLVPADAISKTDHPVATPESVRDSMAGRRVVNQPVLDYLKDK